MGENKNRIVLWKIVVNKITITYHEMTIRIKPEFDRPTCGIRRRPPIVRRRHARKVNTQRFRRNKTCQNDGLREMFIVQ